MILEAAILNVRPARSGEFEAAFREASPIIASMPGYPWPQAAALPHYFYDPFPTVEQVKLEEI